MKLLNARKKLVNLAVASAVAGSCAMLATPAQAVDVSGNNLGQAMIFPYYTVNNGFDTIFSVVNTTDKTTVFKIRFREALNSREVRDFDVILSPYDVWTASITANGSGARLVTRDNTCTYPALNAGTDSFGDPIKYVDFTSAGYDGTITQPAAKAAQYAYDNGGKSLTRTQEGYFEVIDMGESTNTVNPVEYYSTHVNGVPRDCTKVIAAFDAHADSVELKSDTAHGTEFTAFTHPSNSLKGFSSLINVANGTSIDMPPTVLENWQDTNTVLYKAGDLKPTLNDGDADGSTADYMDNGPKHITNIALGTPVDAISADLMATNVINEYTADGTGTFTDWVVTFPTKHFYVDDTLSAPINPFSQLFKTNGYSCDKVSIDYWNREEAKNQQAGGGFSPSGSTSSELCYEVNVITFNNSYVLGGSSASVNRLDINTTDVGTKGWANLSLTGQGTLNFGGTNYTMSGLPVIGFAATVRSVGASSANYGDSEPNSYTHGQ